MAVIFSEDFTGTNGSAWPTARWSSNPGSGTIDIQSNEGRMLSPLSAFTANTARGLTGAVADQELLVKFKYQQIPNADAWFVLRGDTSGTSPANGYLAVINQGGAGDQILYRRSANANTVLGTFSTITLVAGTYYWLRFRCSGTTVQAKLWADGSAEPGSWGFTATDSNHASGAPWVRAGSDGTPTACDLRIDSFVLDDLVTEDTVYRDEVLADSPLLYWRLSDSSVADTSGNGRTGTPTDVSFGSAGKINNAGVFNGASSVIERAYESALNTSQWTVEAWAKTDPTTQNTLRVIASNQPNSGIAGWTLLAQGNKWAISAGTGTLWSVWNDDTAFVAEGQYTHVVATYDGLRYRLYINGELRRTSLSNESFAPNTSGPLRVGAIYNQDAGVLDDWWPGGIDEFAIYGTALSAARIAAHFAKAPHEATDTFGLIGEQASVEVQTRTLYLSNAAADAAVTVGAGTKHMAQIDPTTGTATKRNKLTTAAASVPLQITDNTGTADGTAISWYSKPLATAVLIAGAITVDATTMESANTANVAPVVRIERCSGDGTILSAIVVQTINQGAGEMGTTQSTDSWTIPAASVTDTTVGVGERIRITLWIDDAADQGGTGSFASTTRWGAFFVDGNAANGRTAITFTEVIDVQDPPVSKSASDTFTVTDETGVPPDLMGEGYGGAVRANMTAVTDTGTLTEGAPTVGPPQITLAGLGVAQAQAATGPTLVPGAINLAGLGVAQAQAGTAIALTQVHVLAGLNVAQAQAGTIGRFVYILAGMNVAQGQASTNITLVLSGALAGLGIAQAQASTVIALTQTHVLAGLNVAQAQAATLGALTQLHVLAGLNVAQAQAATGPTLQRIFNLLGLNVAQDQSAPNITLALPGALSGLGVAQAQAATLTGMTQLHVLAGLNVAQAQAATGPTLQRIFNLLGLNVAQAQAATIGTFVYNLGGLNVAQAQAATGPTLVRIFNLAGLNVAHPQASTVIPFGLVLAGLNVTQAQAATLTGLTQLHILAGLNVAQAQQAGPLTIQTQGSLTGLGVAQGQTVPNIVILRIFNLGLANVAQAQTMPQLLLGFGLMGLAVSQTQTTSTIGITQRHQLVLQAVLQAQLMESLVLGVGALPLRRRVTGAGLVPVHRTDGGTVNRRVRGGL